MFRIQLPLLVCVAVFGSGCVQRAAPPNLPSELKNANQVSVQEVFRDACTHEMCIDQLRSLHVRIETAVKRTPEGIAARSAQLQKQYPLQKIVADEFPELLPAEKQVVEIAWDAGRLFCSKVHAGESSAYSWNGKQTVGYVKYPTTTVGVRQPDWVKDADAIWNELLPCRLAKHDVGILNLRRVDESAEYLQVVPDQWQLNGEKLVAGKPRLVLQRSTIPQEFLEIGRDDHQVYRKVRYALPHDWRNSPAKLAIYNRLTGRNFSTVAEAEDWHGHLPEQDLLELTGRYLQEQTNAEQLTSDIQLSDYREIAPGIVFPLERTELIYDCDSPDHPLASECKTTVTILSAGTPLADATLDVQIPLGVEVRDSTHDPCWVYSEKPDRTPEEWAEVQASMEKEISFWRAKDAEMDAFVGKAFAEFPQAPWLNSAPLQMAAQRGKIVLLQFFSFQCRACQSEIRNMGGDPARWANGVFRIGISDDIEDMALAAEAVKAFELKIPLIFSDALFKQYIKSSVCHAYVVDQVGIIVGHGSHQEMQRLAEQLASKLQRH
jgi:hypothetical protein